MPVLTRAWQLLLKGMQEVKESPRPLAAADMVLVRLAYAADLPTPDEALRRLSGLAAGASTSGAAPAQVNHSPPVGARRAIAGSSEARNIAPVAAPAQSPELRLASLDDVVALAAKHRDIQLKMALERDVRIVRFEDGSIEISPTPGASPQLAQILMRRLQEWTGRRWIVAISNEPGAPSLKERRDAEASVALQGVRGLPLVGKVLEHFPGAEIIAVRTAEPAAVATASRGDAADVDEAYSDQTYTEDDL
jgi:DNA polymerase-3 subunit gamma/tau